MMDRARRLWIVKLASVALGPIACGSLFPPLAPLPKAPVIDSAAIARDIAWLAADDRDGRAIGSKGLRQASHYLAEGFEAAGFAKGGDGDSFFRELEMRTLSRYDPRLRRVG